MTCQEERSECEKNMRLGIPHGIREVRLDWCVLSQERRSMMSHVVNTEEYVKGRPCRFSEAMFMSFKWLILLH